MEVGNALLKEGEYGGIVENVEGLEMGDVVHFADLMNYASVFGIEDGVVAFVVCGGGGVHSCVQDLNIRQWVRAFWDRKQIWLLGFSYLRRLRHSLRGM